LANQNLGFSGIHGWWAENMEVNYQSYTMKIRHVYRDAFASPPFAANSIFGNQNPTRDNLV